MLTWLRGTNKNSYCHTNQNSDSNSDSNSDKYSRSDRYFYRNSN